MKNMSDCWCLIPLRSVLFNPACHPWMALFNHFYRWMLKAFLPSGNSAEY